MKKALLLSVVASTMIMAGGDIAPAPVVAAPAVEGCADGWEFTGEAVLYYQTMSDKRGGVINLPDYPVEDMFSANNSAADAGLQLAVVNKDIYGGLGAGVELSGLATLGLEDEVVTGIMQSADGNLNGGAFTQAYLTYGMGNTSLKVGRQQLPLALSPFAFSEDWNVFKNAFEAALIINTSLPNTTLVGAYVDGSNNHTNLQEFDAMTSSGLGSTVVDGVIQPAIVETDGVFMITAQNNSIANLTLTGTWYMAPEALLESEDINILWADAKYKTDSFEVGLQGGTIMGADDIGAEDTTAFGVMGGTTLSMFDLGLAYTSVDEGTAAIENLGTNVKTPLYTQMILNQNFIKSNSDTFMAKAGVAALGGKFGLAYSFSDIEKNVVVPADAEYSELDFTYKFKYSKCTTLFAGYIFQDFDVEDAAKDWDNSAVRLWARYNF